MALASIHGLGWKMIFPILACLNIYSSEKKSFPFTSSIFFFFPSVLGLCCYTWTFSSCGERGLLFVVVRELLIAVASLVAEHRLKAHWLQ